MVGRGVEAEADGELGGVQGKGGREEDIYGRCGRGIGLIRYLKRGLDCLSWFGDGEVCAHLYLYPTNNLRQAGKQR